MKYGILLWLFFRYGLYYETEYNGRRVIVNYSEVHRGHDAKKRDRAVEKLQE